MNYNISKPSGFLSQYVKQYWRMDNFMPQGQIHTQRIVPSGLFELVFYLDDKPEASERSKAINDSMILTGQLKHYHDLKVKGHLSLFAIYFLPHGLSVFLDLPINELLNQSVPLNLILKDKVSQLEDQLYEARIFEAQIVVAEKFLLSQIQHNERKYQYERIRPVVNLINQTKGVIDINDLASKTFLSRKQFERSFVEIIGMSPKQFLKVVRFQNAIYEKSQNSELSLTEIAYKCGYFDQAHMINDFKTLSGITPKSFLSAPELFSDYFED